MEGRTRYSAPLRPQRLEPGDRLGAVAGMVAEVAGRSRPAGSERPSRPVELDQLAVAAADDEHRGAGGDGLRHRRPEPFDQAPVPEPARRGEPSRRASTACAPPRASRSCSPRTSSSSRFASTDEAAAVEVRVHRCRRRGAAPARPGRAVLRADRGGQPHHLAEQVGDLASVGLEQALELSSSRPPSHRRQLRRDREPQRDRTRRTRPRSARRRRRRRGRRGGRDRASARDRGATLRSKRSLRARARRTRGG